MDISHSVSTSFSDDQLKYIVNSKNAGLTWESTTKAVNEHFQLNKSTESIRHAFRRYGSTVIFPLTEEESKKFDIDHFKELARKKAMESSIKKENKILLNYLNANEEILDQVQTALKNLAISKVTIPKLVKDVHKKKMTLELMLSDLHYGRKSENFDVEICRKRMKKLTKTVLAELKSNSKLFNVEKIIIAMLGDMIESYTMHGIESSHACEFGNSRQIQIAIESLYEDLLYPLAMTSLTIEVPCVTGNHDRTERERTMVNPGEANVTWIIYNTLQLFCKQAGFKNITFHIPEGPYVTLDIYGNTVLYEHGDNVRSTTKVVLEKLMANRSTQLGTLIDFLRVGHFHEYTMYDRGRIIVNEGLCGQDSYANVLGFNSHAGQTLNFYVETNSRPNCFYKSYPLYLS